MVSSVENFKQYGLRTDEVLWTAALEEIRAWADTSCEVSHWRQHSAPLCIHSDGHSPSEHGKFLSFKYCSGIMQEPKKFCNELPDHLFNQN